MPTDFLKSENGVHRLVRVSPFNAQGKRMTKLCLVFVSPLVDETIERYVDPAKSVVGYFPFEWCRWSECK